MAQSPEQMALKPWLYGRPGADGEWRGFCTYCEVPGRSKSPSASYNFPVGIWHCLGKCGNGGSIRSLVRKIARGDISVDNVIQMPGTKADEDEKKKKPTKPLPDDAQLTRWTKQLLADPARMKYLRDKRGITDVELIKRLRLGYDRRSQRYTIPIFDERGDLVNVRMYKRNADVKWKMISWGPGWGEGRIYGLETLDEHDEVLLCEGEWDRIVALQHDLPAVTHTAGAGTFKPEWGKRFKGKRVYVAYDNDDSGRRGAQKARRVLESHAEAVYGVSLNLDAKGADVTDFFLLGRTGDEMREQMKSAARWYEREPKHVVPQRGKRVSVEESQNPAHNYPIEMTVMVAGKVTPPYTAPRKLIGDCDMAAGPKCATCYFAANDGHRELQLDGDDPRLLTFIDATKKQKPPLYAELMEAKCTNHVTFTTTEEYTLEELAVQPSIEHRTEEIETPIQRIVYSVGTYKTKINQLARMVGQQRPDPRTNRGVIHAWLTEDVASDLDTFEMTPETYAKLRRFRPAPGQSPLDKCKEIADDLAANVTRIFGRPMLHVGYDLVWHSANSFMFEGKEVTKGWLECLVLGDTRTGKSETASALVKHYKAGTMKPLEGASFAGLVGGAEQAGGKAWMVKWGLIPLNDRRLVVLDEMSGLYGVGKQSKGIIEEMSSIRSEGKAQISKMGSNETSARTRLIWISNPLEQVSLGETSNGCINALQDLVRNPEDIARFDFVMAAAANDVPSKVINSVKHARVRHRHTTTLCNTLVMWAWSRRADQIEFRNGVEELIYQKAESLGKRYIEDPPLIQIANARLKIARLAVAIAARTFSSDRTGEKIVVKKTHVRSAVDFLDEVYGHQAMGYQQYSDRIMKNRKRAQESKEAAREYLRKQPEIVEVLSAVGGGRFKGLDFEQLGGFDRDEASAIMNQLLRWRMIQNKGRGQSVMHPALMELIRELEQ